MKNKQLSISFYWIHKKILANEEKQKRTQHRLYIKQRLNIVTIDVGNNAYRFNPWRLLLEKSSLQIP
jgi:hypothetical protein